MSNFYYTNNDGRRKMLTVENSSDDNNYLVTMYDCKTGECCGFGRKTKEEINKFLEYYKVKKKIGD